MHRQIVSLFAAAAAIVALLPIFEPAARAAEEEPQPASPQVQRARELIYQFRQYRVFSRDEEWAQALRELTQIGKPAVPELVAELDRTDRNQTLRSLGFALRAIGDPRAVPALIRAIPKTLLNQGSDCGVIIVDPELRAFMKANQNHPDTEGNEAWVACGRPVNEILTALDKLTDHPVPHPGAGKNDDRRERRLDWWKQHQDEFPIDDELRAIAKRAADDDPVERAGLAKFGPLFPTGPRWRLGPIHELTLDPNFYVNGKSHVDFDTGRVFEHLEGFEPAPSTPLRAMGIELTKWERGKGIDVRTTPSPGGKDLHAWLIGNERWDGLDDEISRGEPVALGPETTDTLVPFENNRTDFKHDRIGTFLFTTREGGRGILQVFPLEPRHYGRRLRYRMFVSVDAQPKVPVAADAIPKERTALGKVVTMRLPLLATGAECLLDLETERRYALPAGFTMDAYKLFQEKGSADWCRERGIDLVASSSKLESTGGDAPSKDIIQMQGRDMAAVRVLPDSLYRLGVEEVRDLLSRSQDKSPVSWMMIDPNAPEPVETYAIRTSNGTIGLIKFERTADSPSTLTVRYRLHSDGKP